MYKVTITIDGKDTTIHSPYFDKVKIQAGEIKIALNIAAGFNFTLLPSNPGYQLIRPLKTLVKVENTLTNKVEFEGRILMPSESMGESGSFEKSYIAESELAYLNDSRQRHGEYHDITVQEFLEIIIDNHNQSIADDDIDKKFEVGIVDIDSSSGTLYRYLGYENTYETIKDKLLDRLGGELRIRKENGVRYLDYLKTIGSRKSTEIRLAKNLKSITKEINISEVVTRLVPLGKSIESEDEAATDASEARLTIESINDGKDYLIDEAMEKALGTVIVGTETWDDITQPSILKTRGEQFLAENNRPKSQHKISALDLSLIGIDPDAFEVGNWHPVINPVMRINEDLRIIEKTIDIISPENNDLTIGDKFKTASDFQKESNQSQQKIVNLQNTVERQAQRIVYIQDEVTNVNQSLEDLAQAFNDADIPEIENAIGNLADAVENLTDAVDSIPAYGLATAESDGLMSKEDKVKSDLIQLTQSIDLDQLQAGLQALTDKLNLITVINPIDLDELEGRVTALEENEE